MDLVKLYERLAERTKEVINDSAVDAEMEELIARARRTTSLAEENELRKIARRKTASIWRIRRGLVKLEEGLKALSGWELRHEIATSRKIATASRRSPITSDHVARIVTWRWDGASYEKIAGRLAQDGADNISPGVVATFCRKCRIRPRIRVEVPPGGHVRRFLPWVPDSWQPDSQCQTQSKSRCCV